MTSTLPPHRFTLLATALFAFGWIVLRAHTQAVTMDEAVTYINWVRPQGFGIWQARSNNHLLNSLVMRVFTSIFGVSNLTVRSGALIGAALYISAAYRLSDLVAPGFLLRWTLFVCLVFNPFIQDFLVAARGYSLASAFLLWPIALVASFEMRASREIPATSDVPTSAEITTPDGVLWKPLLIVCGQASVLIALSFIANFSFAFVDGAALLMIFLWACGSMPRESSGANRWNSYLKLAAACALPGLFVVAALAGRVLTHYPKNELVYGAESFGETLRSLYEASIYQLNPNLMIQPADLAPFITILFLFIGGISAIRLGQILSTRASVAQGQARMLDRLADGIAGTLLLTVAASWLAFHVRGLPWPKDRTGIYLVILATLLAGLIAAIPIPTLWGNLSRQVLTAALFGLAIYFLLCLRVGYFKEWIWNADMDKVYSALASYNRSCGVKSPHVNWRFDASLNYYRILSGKESFIVFPPDAGPPFAEYPDSQPLYVLYGPEDADYPVRHGLSVVYSSKFGTVIAIDPAVCGTQKPPDAP